MGQIRHLAKARLGIIYHKKPISQETGSDDCCGCHLSMSQEAEMIFYNTAPHSLISLSHTYQPSCFTLARLHTLTPTANSFHPQSNEHTSPPLLYYNDKLSSQPVLSMTPSSMCTLIYIYTHTPVPLVYLPAPSHTGEDVRPIIRALLWARGRGQLHERSLINEKDR